MARKGKGKDAESEKSAEYKAFEAAARQILSVPKKELDRREQEWKSTRTK